MCKTCSSLHQDYLPSSHHRAVKGEPNMKMRKLTHSEIKCHIASAVWIRNPCTPESTVFFHLISIKQNSGTKRSLHCLFLPQTRLSFTPCTTITSEPVLCNKRSCHSEKPAHDNEEQPLFATTRESPHAAMKNHHSQKKKTNV